MFDYMLFTNVSAHTHRSKSKFFWDEDIVEHGEKWNEMKKATTETDREAFEAWKKERLDYVESVAKVSQYLALSPNHTHPQGQALERCKKVALDLYNLKVSDARDDRRQRLNA